MLRKLISSLFTSAEEQERQIQIKRQLRGMKIVDEIIAEDEKEKYLRRLIRGEKE